jgi:hypothetical protein
VFLQCFPGLQSDRYLWQTAGFHDAICKFGGMYFSPNGMRQDEYRFVEIDRDHADVLLRKTIEMTPTFVEARWKNAMRRWVYWTGVRLGYGYRRIREHVTG